MRTEGWFADRLMLALKDQRSLLAIRHEDEFTAGVPDISTTGFGVTCWWELKAICEEPSRYFRTGSRQLLTCYRLELMGTFCRYIVWVQIEKADFIVFIKPSELMEYFKGEPRALGPKQILEIAQRAPAPVIADHDFKWLVTMIEAFHSKRGHVNA